MLPGRPGSGPPRIAPWPGPGRVGPWPPDRLPPRRRHSPGRAGSERIADAHRGRAARPRCGWSPGGSFRPFGQPREFQGSSPGSGSSSLGSSYGDRIGVHGGGSAGVGGREIVLAGAGYLDAIAGLEVTAGGVTATVCGAHRAPSARSTSSRRPIGSGTTTTGRSHGCSGRPATATNGWVRGRLRLLRHRPSHRPAPQADPRPAGSLTRLAVGTSAAREWRPGSTGAHDAESGRGASGPGYAPRARGAVVGAPLARFRWKRTRPSPASARRRSGARPADLDRTPWERRGHGADGGPGRPGPPPRGARRR